jgi:hypothetical protein
MAIAGLAVAVAMVAGGAVFVLGRGDDTPSGDQAGQVTATPSAEATPAATPPPATETPPEATPTPAGPTPTPTPRNVNGLQVIDETWVGRVAEPGGLRIRNAPQIQSGNVVGSVPQGAEINVEGRVLNGQEAEPGKGTVWLIVGPNQYIYGAQGYVERIR